jgi:hypothetical protein
MPLKYKILQDRKLVYVVGTEKVTFAELLAHLGELAKDPGYRAPMKKLIDYRYCEPLNLSTAEMETFSRKKASYANVFAGEQCAIITKVDVDFGMARMHGAHIEQKKIDTMVFRDMKPALEWLSLTVGEDELKIEFTAGAVKA